MNLINMLDLTIAGLWVLISIIHSRDFDNKSSTIWMATMVIILFVIRNILR